MLGFDVMAHQQDSKDSIVLDDDDVAMYAHSFSRLGDRLEEMGFELLSHYDWDGDGLQGGIVLRNYSLLLEKK